MHADQSSRATPVSPAAWKQMLRGSRVVTGPSINTLAEGGSTSGEHQPVLDSNQVVSEAAAADSSASESGASHSETPANKPVVLDVRNAYEWDAGHFQGAARPLEDAFNETPREADNGKAALPEALKGAAPDTPVMVRRLLPLLYLILAENVFFVPITTCHRHGLHVLVHADKRYAC
jgi:rhodanese-related sulfurtransferase